ncbi:MAG: globin domain-containing protein [Myxococcota bacterium]
MFLVWGRLNRRLVTVKLIRDARLASGTPAAEDARSTALREIDKSAHLEHPCFLRIADAFHDGGDFYVVTDFAPSRTIRAVMRDEARAGTGGRFDVVRTVGILHQLAEALIDGQRCGLRFMAINPSEVFLNHDETSGEARAQLTPLNFAWFLAQLSADTNVLFTLEKGPFTAPERFVPGLLEPPTTREAESWAIDRANQFSLGMLGWTMLEGRQPFQGIEGETAYHRMRRFEQEAPSFSERVSQAPWRTEGQALFRIIERLVRYRPEERWTDMTQVSHLLGALEGEKAGAEVERRVKGAYHEVCLGNEGFYREFYERLFEHAPHLRAIFPMGETPEAQRVRLDSALGQLLNYRQQQREPTTLSAIRASHRPRGLSGDDYRSFGHALIETFEARLPRDGEHAARLAALEIVIWPALYYFIDDPERGTPRKDTGATAAS